MLLVKRFFELWVNVFGVVSVGIFWYCNIGCRLVVDFKKENVLVYYGVIVLVLFIGIGFSCLCFLLLVDERI